MISRKIVDCLNTQILSTLLYTKTILKENLKDDENEKIELKMEEYRSKIYEIIESENSIENPEIEIHKLSLDFLGELEEYIDEDRFATMALSYSIKELKELKKERQNGLNSKKTDIYLVSRQKAENDILIRIIDTLKRFLYKKQVKIAYIDSEISSVDLCAENITDLNGNVIGKSEDNKKYIEFKREQDIKNAVRKEKNKETIDELGEDILECMLSNLYMQDFAYCSTDDSWNWINGGIWKWIDPSIIEKTRVENNGTVDLTYDDVNSSSNFLDGMKYTLGKYLEYIKMKDFLLISGYRMMQSMEDIDKVDDLEERKKILKGAKDILEIIQEKVEQISENNRNVRSKVLKDPSDYENLEEITYRLKDLKKDITRILPSGIVASKELIGNTKKSLNSGELNLRQVDRELLKFMNLETSEILNYAVISEENLRFVLENYDLSEQQISKIFDRSAKISTDVINILLNNNQITNEDFLKLFKEGKIKAEDIHGHINGDEIEKIYESGEISKKQLIELFNNGDIEVESMSVLISLSGIEKDILEALDNKELDIKQVINVIKDDAMCSLEDGYIYSKYTNKDEEKNFKTLDPMLLGVECGKLSIEELDKLYSEGIVKEEDLYNAAIKGFFSKERIEQLYLKSLISDTVLDNLSKEEVITEAFAKSVKNKLQVESILGSYPFSSDSLGILNLPKSKIQRTEGNGGGSSNGGKKGKGFDPEFKEAIIGSLGNGIVKIPEENFAYDKKNPFFDYEFWIIPEKNGTISPESAIIAEKLYESRTKRDAWAYGDATYIFKLKDFKRIGKKSRKELTEFMKGKKTEEKENYNSYKGVGRVIHKSPEYWSTKLGKKISSLLGESKMSIYTEEELNKIANAPILINNLDR